MFLEFMTVHRHAVDLARAVRQARDALAHVHTGQWRIRGYAERSSPDWTDRDVIGRSDELVCALGKTR